MARENRGEFKKSAEQLGYCPLMRSTNPNAPQRIKSRLTKITPKDSPDCVCRPEISRPEFLAHGSAIPCTVHAAGRLHAAAGLGGCSGGGTVSRRRSRPLARVYRICRWHLPDWISQRLVCLAMLRGQPFLSCGRSNGWDVAPHYDSLSRLGVAANMGQLTGIGWCRWPADRILSHTPCHRHSSARHDVASKC